MKMRQSGAAAKSCVCVFVCVCEIVGTAPNVRIMQSAHKRDSFDYAQVQKQHTSSASIHCSIRIDYSVRTARAVLFHALSDSGAAAGGFVVRAAYGTRDKQTATRARDAGTPNCGPEMHAAVEIEYDMLYARAQV